MRKNIYKISLLSLALVGITFGANKVEAQKKTYMADKVIAVVGDKMILYSDLIMSEEYYKYQNRIPEGDILSEKERANLLSHMLLQNLLSTQARIDSLPENTQGIENAIEDRVKMFIEQYGSAEAVEKIRNKPMFIIKDDLKKQIEDQYLAEDMKSSVINSVTLTPIEVKRIFRKIDNKDVPLIPIQYSYSQIVKRAPDHADAQLAIKEELLKLRARVLKGDNFGALARMYSDDQGSAMRGGDMGFQSPNALVSEFADAMQSLQIGQVSNVVETEYGQHIIELLDKKNDLYRCRHILIRTKFSVAEMSKAMSELDSLREVLIKEPSEFKEIVYKYSNDINSRSNKGRVINDSKAMYQGLRSQTDKFFVDELKDDYSHLKDLEITGLSEPYQTYDDSGNKICKIVRLDRIIPEHKANIEDDYTVLVDMALDIRKQEVFDLWLKEKIAKLYIKIEEPYRSYDFEDIEWVK